MIPHPVVHILGSPWSIDLILYRNNYNSSWTHPCIDSRPLIHPCIDSRPLIHPCIDYKRLIHPCIDSRPLIHPWVYSRPLIHPCIESRPLIHPCIHIHISGIFSLMFFYLQSPLPLIVFSIQSRNFVTRV